MSVIIKVCNGGNCCKNLGKYTFQRAAVDLQLDENKGGTTKDNKYILEKTACRNKCSEGPIVEIKQSKNSKFYKNVTSVKMGEIIKNLKK